MKKIIHVFVTIFTITFFITNAFAQDEADMPHSIINIVRSGKFRGSACRTDIIFPNQRKFNLSLNSTVQYKIFSEGEILVTVEISCPGTQYTLPSDFSTQVSLTVKRGEEYYLLYDVKFEQVEKADVQKLLDKQTNVLKQEENLDFPINKNSLKDIVKKDGEGQGTCFLVNADGYFITNFHCIENAEEIMIKGIDGDFTTKYGATVVASDRSNDLALLKISNKNVKFTKPPFSIRSYGIAQAERVYALGFPIAQVMGEEVKITEGIISARSGAQGDISRYQISASVNPGSSGGPLIDENGNLIGVIYAKSTVADAAGYAIKSSYLETFLKNVDLFEFPILTDLTTDITFPQKVEMLKNFIFILETK